MKKIQCYCLLLPTLGCICNFSTTHCPQQECNFKVTESHCFHAQELLLVKKVHATMSSVCMVDAPIALMQVHCAAKLKLTCAIMKIKNKNEQE